MNHAGMNTQKKLTEIVEWFEHSFPETLPERLIGLEKEYPVVCAGTYEAGDARAIFQPLIELGWIPLFDDVYRQEIMGVIRHGIRISTDAGWCTLEIMMPPMPAVLEATSILQDTERLIGRIARDVGLIVLGYGIQPVTKPGAHLWNKRYRGEVARSALPDAFKNLTITASDQVHVGIARHELVQSANVFNALSGIFVRLFAHAPFWGGALDSNGRTAVRETMWDEIGVDTTGIPPHRSETTEEYVRYMAALPMRLAKREGVYVVPGVSFVEWAMEHDDWRKQWKYHESCTWHDARLRAMFGTVEIRPVCSQMPGENARLAAMVLGLAENLDEAARFVEGVEWHEWITMRQNILCGSPDERIASVTTEALDIARDGLKKKNAQDAPLLDALYERSEHNIFPADVLGECIKQGGVHALIERARIGPATS